MDGRLHRGTFTESAGGVARNMCEVLCKLNNPPHFLTAIGKDSAGHFLRKSIDQQSTKLIQQSDDDTSQCAVILDNKGECKLLIGQMKVHDTITSQIVRKYLIRRFQLIMHKILLKNYITKRVFATKKKQFYPKDSNIICQKKQLFSLKKFFLQ